ncbi:MAG TPA: tRNA uracil 4-sulfurtransferase ThiI [Candidatus Lokiarchaeia archaeon]|nr:tRNA uracil 4-sulfurtransferase ThiI [Candidatus Lokiarchaeia archaeon]
MLAIVIHYAEIGIKKGNRAYFERLLSQNIRQKVGKKPLRHYGSLIVENIKEEEVEPLLYEISRTPGVANLSIAQKSDLSVDAFIQTIEKFIESDKSFKIITRRSNKSFELTSEDVNRAVGEYFFNLGYVVDVHNPEQRIFIEIVDQNAYIYNSKVKGIGGLPSGTEGKALALISGGIDSPVAAFLMAKRGCKVHLIHFHNERGGSYDKVEQLARLLAGIEGHLRLFVVPFNQIQNHIIAFIPPECRMIVYRRLMGRIACAIAMQIHAKGIITGDSLGQVASQTMDNLFVIREAYSLPLYSPLIGLDKEEIMEIARKLGTYDISIRPYADCCSYMIAKHPDTRSRLEDILELEQGIDLDSLVEQGLHECQEFHI